MVPALGRVVGTIPVLLPTASKKNRHWEDPWVLCPLHVLKTESEGNKPS